MQRGMRLELLDPRAARDTETRTRTTPHTVEGYSKAVKRKVIRLRAGYGRGGRTRRLGDSETVYKAYG